MDGLGWRCGAGGVWKALGKGVVAGVMRRRGGCVLRKTGGPWQGARRAVEQTRVRWSLRSWSGGGGACRKPFNVCFVLC